MGPILCQSGGPHLVGVPQFYVWAHTFVTGEWLVSMYFIIFLTRFQRFLELGLKKRVLGIQFSKRYSRRSVELVHNLLPFSHKQSPNFFCLTSLVGVATETK